MHRWLILPLLVASWPAAGCAHPPSPAAPAGGETTPVVACTPIGSVSKPAAGPAELRIDPRFADGLLGLDGWSHVQVIYWFDRNDTPEKRAILQVHPRGDARNPRTGVFACRAPVRPNLIALSTCRILAVRGGVVTVDEIDAFDGTPILDLKPWAPGPDRARGAIRTPDWVRRRDPAGDANARPRSARPATPEGVPGTRGAERGPSPRPRECR